MDEGQTQAPSPTGFSTHDILAVVYDSPGLTATQIAERVGSTPQRVSSRLHAMKNAKTPEIKGVNIGGSTCWYPFSAQVTVDPLQDKPGTVINVGGEPVRMVKMSAEELEELEREKPIGKYSEIIEALDTLEIGEALVFPRAQVQDGIRHNIHGYFKSRKKFSNKNTASHIIIKRVPGKEENA